MFPQAALVDPELTLTVPPDMTAATGMDALAQLVEPFVSVRANPLTDAMCRDGIALVSRSLKRAFADGLDVAAREDMALAALLSGMALTNAGLGAVHGLAAALGGLRDAPHGALCARLLPAVMAVNIRILGRHEPAGRSLQRYAAAASILAGSEGAKAEDGVRWVEQLVGELGIPPLRDLGFSRADFEDACARAARASSMQGNPVTLGDDELREILEKAL